MALKFEGVGTVFVTVSVNVSVAVALLPSVAITVISMAPTSPFEGVPLKVREEASKLNQLGRVFPSESVAV